MLEYMAFTNNLFRLDEMRKLLALSHEQLTPGVVTEIVWTWLCICLHGRAPSLNAAPSDSRMHEMSSIHTSHSTFHSSTLCRRQSRQGFGSRWAVALSFQILQQLAAEVQAWRACHRWPLRFGRLPHTWMCTRRCKSFRRAVP